MQATIRYFPRTNSEKKKKSIWMSILHSTGLNVGFSGLTNTCNYKGWCINNSNESKRFQYALTFKKLNAIKIIVLAIETPK